MLRLCLIAVIFHASCLGFEIEDDFPVCESTRDKITVDKRDCFDIVSTKKQDCHMIVEAVEKNIDKNDYFSKTSNDIVLYHDNKTVYRTECKPNKKIRVPDTIDSKNAGCLFDLALEYENKDGSFSIGYLTKEGVIRKKTKQMSCEIPETDSFTQSSFNGFDITKSGK